MGRYYKYTLEKAESFEMVTLDGITFDAEWIMIHNGILTIKAKYSWDGCSPKVKVLGMVIGTWDGPKGSQGHQKARTASLVHDALYQYLNDLEKLGYTRRKADKEFLRLMNRENFLMANVYYRAVRLFGGLFRKLSK